MAVYIPKSRLGSGSGVAREERLKQRIESTPGFKALRQRLAEAKEERKEALADKWESNAEVHRWRSMSKEEQARDAIERLVPTAKAVEESRTGKECSYDDARKSAEKIAYRHDADKAEKK
ncbi:MAG: hypothetical protein E6R03_09660 [Hyphomicrobiaceae bacterium]|nr:MAG: hypothetical protein E6R03_09660 [Hyphomicrobiaceae bacterium]